MKCRLVVQQGAAQGQVIPVPWAQFLIGRDAHCHLRPRSTFISKRHCAILIREGQVYVCDFDSTNGTFLNGEPVRGQQPVRDGDELRLGPLVFRVRIEADPEALAPPPAHRDEDSIAALLLDSDEHCLSPPAAYHETVPDGDTVTELPAATESPSKPRPEAPPPTPAPPESTADAAGRLLAKFSRRSRS